MDFDRYSGFSLVELLVAASILGIVIALAITPLREVSTDVLRTRDESFAVLQNLAFIENLGRDVRRSRGIMEANSDRIILAPAADADTVIWRFGVDVASRISGAATVPFPIRVSSLIVAPRENVAPIRYFILRGDFAGLGTIERGMAVRTESDTGL